MTGKAGALGLKSGRGRGRRTRTHRGRSQRGRIAPSPQESPNAPADKKAPSRRAGHRSPLPPTAVAGARPLPRGGGGGAGAPRRRSIGAGAPKRRRGLRHGPEGDEPAALRVLKRAVARKDKDPTDDGSERQRGHYPTEQQRGVGEMCFPTTLRQPTKEQKPKAIQLSP